MKNPGLVIFDCDGVLIDSEGIASRVTAERLTELGWEMDAAEAEQRFLGMSLTDMEPIIAARLGTLPAGFATDLAQRLADRLADDAVTIPGAREVLEAVSALGIPWRIASNSGHAELAAKFTRTGLATLVAGRVHSAEDVIAKGGSGKPAPDLFLDTAAAEGVAPAHCLVVEDSTLGVRGAVAAGMDVLGFAPHGDGGALREAGASGILHALAELPPLLRQARGMTVPFFAELYPWTKALHVVSLIAWLAGLFYLPRLYVYHCDVAPGSAESERFKVMERRLLKQITTPAMIATWIFGIILVLTPGIINWSSGWWHVKLLCVILLTGFHGATSRWRRDFLHDRNTRPPRFYRMANEIPTALMLVIVIMVIVRPF